MSNRTFVEPRQSEYAEALHNGMSIRQEDLKALLYMLSVQRCEQQ